MEAGFCRYDHVLKHTAIGPAAKNYRFCTGRPGRRGTGNKSVEMGVM